MLSRAEKPRSGSLPSRGTKLNLWLWLWILILFWPICSWLFYNNDTALKTQHQASSAYIPTAPVQHP